jgi:uncharacterized membrane protein
MFYSFAYNCSIYMRMFLMNSSSSDGVTMHPIFFLYRICPGAIGIVNNCLMFICLNLWETDKVCMFPIISSYLMGWNTLCTLSSTISAHLWDNNRHWLESRVKVQSLCTISIPLLYGVICMVLKSVIHPLKEKIKSYFELNNRI